MDLGRESWRTWLVSGYVLVVLLLATVWGFTIYGPISQLVTQRQYEQLASIARAANVAVEGRTDDPGSTLERIAADDDVRMTLIAADGTVIADSADFELEMSNHATRPEVEDALSGQMGKDQRTSATDGIEYLYVAIPTTWNGEESALRVSQPATEVNAALWSLRRTGLALLGVAVLGAAIISWLFFSRTSAPMNRLERVRTDFVANASHELKTPVAGIRLLSEAIHQASDEGETELVSAFAERLDHESTRLQNLVTDLMDLSRIEGGGRQQSNESCDLASIVATSFDGHVARARVHGLAFALEDEVEGTARVNLSSTDATLIVDNLIDNALSYTEEGGVTVKLRKDKTTATLEVIDTGVGIPIAEQERIFERFYRVDQARSHEHGGTGLGLSLVRHAVNRGGGSVRVESEPGVGSTFTVKLPLA